MERRPIIGVMGSHDKKWTEFAEPLGEMIANFDYHLLTGAGAGVMTAVAKGFTSVQNRMGSSIGIVPIEDYEGGLVSREQYPNPYIEIPIVTQLEKKVSGDINPYSRNYTNILSSHALVFLPGEHGTQNEASLALKYNKPSILFGPEDALAAFPEESSRVETIEEVSEFLQYVSAKFRTDYTEDS